MRLECIEVHCQKCVEVCCWECVKVRCWKCVEVRPWKCVEVHPWKCIDVRPWKCIEVHLWKCTLGSGYIIRVKWHEMIEIWFHSWIPWISLQTYQHGSHWCPDGKCTEVHAWRDDYQISKNNLMQRKYMQKTIACGKSSWLWNCNHNTNIVYIKKISCGLYIFNFPHYPFIAVTWKWYTKCDDKLFLYIDLIYFMKKKKKQWVHIKMLLRLTINAPMLITNWQQY